jgi:uncharacterized pyridoxamine 5'-phosphate oxidase family protein
MNAINFYFQQIEENPEVLVNEFNLDFLMVFSDSYNTPKTYTIGRCKVLELFPYPSLDDFSIKYDYSLITLLKDDQIQILKVLDRYFSSINKSKATFKHLMDYYYKIIHYSNELINKHSIDFIFTWDIPHKPLNFTIYTIAKLKNIRVVGSTKIPSENYKTQYIRYLSEEFPRLDNHFYSKYNEYLNRVPMITVEELKSYSKDIYNKYHGITEQKYIPRYGDKWTIINTIKSLYSRNKSEFFKPNTYKKIHRLLPYIRTFTIDKAYKKLLIHFINQVSVNLSESDLSIIKYLYYPLHFQPEATTVPLGGVFDNQLLVLDLLSNNLPIDWKIIVKEHPAYIYRLSSTEGMDLSRNKKFYNQILSKKNVYFVGFQGNSYSLIKSSTAVVTVTGTVAFEALALNKPAIVFGDYIMNDLPNSIQIKSEKDLVDAFENIMSNKNDYSNMFLPLLKALETVSVPLSISNLMDKSRVKIELYDFLNKVKKMELFSEIK